MAFIWIVIVLAELKRPKVRMYTHQLRRDMTLADMFAERCITSFPEVLGAQNISQRLSMGQPYRDTGTPKTVNVEHAHLLESDANPSPI